MLASSMRISFAKVTKSGKDLNASSTAWQTHGICNAAKRQVPRCFHGPLMSSRSCGVSPKLSGRSSSTTPGTAPGSPLATARLSKLERTFSASAGDRVTKTCRGSSLSAPSPGSDWPWLHRMMLDDVSPMFTRAKAGRPKRRPRRQRKARESPGSSLPADVDPLPVGKPDPLEAAQSFAAATSPHHHQRARACHELSLMWADLEGEVDPAAPRLSGQIALALGASAFPRQSSWITGPLAFLHVTRLSICQPSPCR